LFSPSEYTLYLKLAVRSILPFLVLSGLKSASSTTRHSLQLDAGFSMTCLRLLPVNEGLFSRPFCFPKNEQVRRPAVNMTIIHQRFFACNDFLTQYRLIPVYLFSIPQFLLGSGPISNSSLPPFSNSAAGKLKLFNGLPFNLADCTYLFRRDV